MKKVLKCGLLFLLFITGCKSPTSVQETPPSDFQEHLKNVNIEQVDYFTILFESTDSLLVDPNEVDRIIFGYYKDELFIGADTLTPMHTHNNSSALLTFSDSLTVSDSLSDVTVGLKYIFTHYSPVTVNKDFFLFSYPYETTRIILNYNTFLPIGWIEDFVYRYPILYYHPTGPEGLFQYNAETGQTKSLIEYPGGDYIDGNSEYIFIDNGGYEVRRYNLNTDSVEVRKQLVSGANGNYISGIAVNDSMVYVLTAGPDKLFTLNYDLETIDIMDFPGENCYSLTYHNGFLYSLKYNPDYRSYIIKIDASTGFITDRNKSPTLHTVAIKISEDGFLYFMEDVQKKFCYTQLDEIF
jgi:hypothetical protein